MDAKHSGMRNEWSVLWRLGKRRGCLTRGGMAEWELMNDKLNFPLPGLFKLVLLVSIRGCCRLV